MLADQLLADPAFKAIVDRFIAEVPDRLRNLEAAIGENNHGEARRLAHQLKGAGGSFGFPAITNAASGVEDACMTCDIGGDLEALMDQLEATCNAVIADWSAKSAAS
ncbi:MAG: Hpt domain-containing protein [Planctomycetota bacterium]